MTKTTTNKQLAEMFARFNDDFFAGRLRRYRVRFGKRVKGMVAPTGCCDDKRRMITLILHRLNNEAYIESTLLHEMAHAATSGYHGERFRAEMRRLKDAGAPVGDYDLRDDGPKYLTRRMVEGVAEDYFGDARAGRFVRFLRHLAREETGSYPADLIARYPWVRAAFERAKKRHVVYLRERDARKKKYAAWLMEQGRSTTSSKSRRGRGRDGRTDRTRSL